MRIYYSRWLVGRVGYYLPFVVLGSAVTAIGGGLISSLTPFSSTGKWIGFQILTGLGRGAALQMVFTSQYVLERLKPLANHFKPILAVQNNVKPIEIPVAMSLIVFFQTMGSSLFISFAQTTFSNGLINALPGFAPGIDVPAIISAGASGFRSVAPPALLRGVLLAYNEAVNHVFYLVAGVAVGAFISGWGMGWKSLKKPKVVVPEA